MQDFAVARGWIDIAWCRMSNAQEAQKAPPGRLLIVDDEANAREALLELLTDEGYEARVAKDGADALAQMEEWTPEVILTDLKMPKVDGLQVVWEVRRASRLSPRQRLGC